MTDWISRIEQAPPDDLPTMLGQLEEARARVWMRLNRPTSAPALAAEPSGPDSLVDIEEAAKLLKISKSWIYKNSATLPFIVRPNGRSLRFSTRGIAKFLQQRTN